MAESSPSGRRDKISPFLNTQFIPSPDPPQSGWERVQELFQHNGRGEYSEELEYIAKSGVTGLFVGLLYGGVPAARYSREQYIKQSQAEIYQHRMEAVRSAHNAAIRGFIRYGMRWGWRVAAFATIFNGVSTVMSTYQDKVAASHYVVAGAVAGGVFRLNLGLRGLVAGSTIGAMLGLPLGLLVTLIQSVTGENLQEHKHRKRRERYEEKMREWQERLQVSDEVIRDIEKMDRESAVREMQRITELLEQPRNPEHTPESETSQGAHAH